MADFNGQLHAYCLMSNHDHLRVETPGGNLPAGQAPALQVPRGRHRFPPMPLAEIAARHPNRDGAIADAHATGHYSDTQIADHLGLHFTTVGRVARRREARRMR